LAEPGGVCVAAAVYDQVRDRIDVAFEDLGEKEVKNIDRPVRVWRWVHGHAATTYEAAGATNPSPLSDKPSIVVLPFDNMSRDPEQEYFSDGISEDIITDLSKVSGMLVIARNSAFSYKGKTFNIPDVCRDLGVRFALEGSVRKAGNRVRVTAQLIDGSSGGHLWAERYDRDLTDIFEVQDDVTRQIVTALKVTLSAEEKSRIGDSGTKNINAHDLFLRGRGLLMSTQRDREMFEQAQVYLRRAIEIDPDYGAPYGGLGMAHILDYQNRWSDTPEESLEKAKRFADEAIAKDGNDPYGHYAAAIAAMFRRDYTRWAEEAERALELDPNHAPALNARGIVHIYTGNPKEAVPFIERAMRLDPALHQQYMHFLGVAYFVAGDYATAATMFKDRIAVNPKTDLSRAYLASALAHLGDMKEARRVWAELQDINPDYSHEEHIGRLPFRDPADAAKMADGLRKAGLVD
jgi:adenylate cyclase